MARVAMGRDGQVAHSLLKFSSVFLYKFYWHTHFEVTVLVPCYCLHMNGLCVCAIVVLFNY